MTMTVPERTRLIVGRRASKAPAPLQRAGRIRDIIKLYGMEHCHPVSTPATSTKLTKDMCPRSDADLVGVLDERIDYRPAVSALQYACKTRPDIKYAVGQVGRFVQNPGVMHYKALKRIFRYLKGTLDYGLQYTRTTSTAGGKPTYLLAAMSDSDWAGNQDDRKSTSGYLITVNGNTISFKAKAQQCTALSSSEAETIALTLTAQEVLWLRDVLAELGFPQIEPTTIFCDNVGANAFAKDVGNHTAMKHINLREFFVKEAVANKIITTSYIRSVENTADRSDVAGSDVFVGDGLLDKELAQVDMFHGGVVANILGERVGTDVVMSSCSTAMLGSSTEVAITRRMISGRTTSANVSV
ncbi:Reverse transcriptase Ty1/copia-type domain-containing protein [Plasmodiophora brassicae]